MLAALLVLCCFAVQELDPPSLQPYRRTSPDGRWELSVDPSDRRGDGPARYRCTHDGKSAWSGDKPWTFSDAIVTNEGFSAGYAYSDAFHAVILAPDGMVRLDDATKRESSRFMHMPANPLGNGLFEQPDLRRIVFRIADPDVNRKNEEWWCYRLPDGKEEFRKHPRDAFDRVGRADSVVAARGLAGTRFTLVEWRIFDWPTIGLRFTLVDPDLAPVWDLPRPDEMMIGANERDTDRMRSSVYRLGTIFEETPAGRFAIGLPKSEVKIHFAIRGDPTRPTVEEIGREPWSLPGEPKPSLRLGDLPLAQLEARGEFQIQVDSKGGSPIREVAAFDVSVPGILRVVRKEEDRTFTLLRVDATEKVLLERKVELPDAAPDLQPQFWALGPRAWLATQSPFGEGARARAWRIDEEKGEASPIADFDCPSIQDVAALDGERFVVLATEREKYTSTKFVRGFDAKGTLLWEIEQDNASREPSTLFSPESIAVTTDGLVAVLDVIRHTVQTFDGEGTFRSVVDLRSAWNREPRYPCVVRSDVEGGIVVHDFNGDPPLYRMRADGSVRAKLAPRFPDDKAPGDLARRVRTDGDGRLWTTDGQRLLRMDDDGTIQQQLGTQAVEGVLTEPWAVAVDVLGRVLVQDKATCAIHVFDGRGKPLFVCRPASGDHDEANLIAHLGATRDSGVLAQSGMFSKFLRFGPDGVRKERLEPKLGGGQLVASPVSDELYAGVYGGSLLRLGPDLSERAKLDRAPDGSWLNGGASLAGGPDGALLVWHRRGTEDSPPEFELVLFEKPETKEARALPLPSGTRCTLLELGRTWAAANGYGDEVLLVRRSDGRPVRFRVTGEEKEKESWRFGFDPKVEELVAVEARSLRIRRYALP